GRGWVAKDRAVEEIGSLGVDGRRGAPDESQEKTDEIERSGDGDLRELTVCERLGAQVKRAARRITDKGKKVVVLQKGDKLAKTAADIDRDLGVGVNI